MCMIQGYCISALGQNFFLRIFNRQNQLWCIGAYMYHDFSTHISRSSSSKKLSNNRIMNGQIHMYFHFFLTHIFKPLEFDLRQSKDSRNFQFECWLAGRHWKFCVLSAFISRIWIIKCIFFVNFKNDTICF